jgi:hypothetical protein
VASRRRPRVVVEADGFYGFGLSEFGVVEDSMAGGYRGMAGGGGRPGGDGGLWAARPGGDGAAGRVVEDNRWEVPAAVAVMKGGLARRGREVGGTARRRGRRRPWAVMEVSGGCVGAALNEEGLGEGGGAAGGGRRAERQGSVGVAGRGRRWRPAVVGLDGRRRRTNQGRRKRKGRDKVGGGPTMCCYCAQRPRAR